MQTKLRLGIAGAGRPPRKIGDPGTPMGWLYAHAAQSVSEVSIVAVMDRNADRAEALARYTQARPYTEYKDLLDSNVDAILVLLPNAEHAPTAISAAHAHKHVFVIKPLGISLEEATAIIAACRRAQVQLMVAFPFRFHRELQEARRIIAAGALGTIALVHQHISASGAHLTPWYWSSLKAGGGIVIHDGTHAVDCMRWLLGSNLAEVFAKAGPQACGKGVEDTVVATLTFDNGAVGSLAMNFVPFRMRTKWDIDIYGSTGALRINVWHSLEMTDAQSTSSYPHQPDEPFKAQLRELAAAIQEGRDPWPGGDDGKLAMAGVQAIYRSMQSGSPVHVAKVLGSA